MGDIPVSDNHRRAIGTALCQFDQLLGEVAEFAAGRARHGVLFREVNELTPQQRRMLMEEIEALRRTMEICRGELGLPVTTERVVTRVWGGTAAFWEVLVETSAQHLQRYGEVPVELARFLDPHIEDLIRGLTRITEAVAAPSAKGDAGDGDA